VENHKTYHAERSPSRGFKQVPDEYESKKHEKSLKKNGGRVGEGKEKQPGEVRFVRIFWVLQLSDLPRNANITSKCSIHCRRNGGAQLHSTITSEVFSSVLSFLVRAGQEIAMRAPI